MKKKSSVRSFISFGTIPGSLLAVILAILVPVLGYADKLVVQDSGGGTAFVVTENGRVGVETQTPTYQLDVTGKNVPRSQLHFSLAGADTGGWVTSVGENNFFLSSGAMYDQSAGGWIQKSSDGKAVIAGSGAAGYRVFTASGTSVGSAINPPPLRLQIDYSGNMGINTPADPTVAIDTGTGAYLSLGGAWTNNSSRNAKENIESLDSREALVTLASLDPVKFNYKADASEKHVGFIAEDVPDLVATKDRKGLSPMDIVAVLTKVVQEQQTPNANLVKKLAELEAKLEALQK